MTQTTTQHQQRHPRSWNSRWFWLSIGAVFLLLVLSANAHLVFVAIKSQPGCVPHDKVADSTTSQMRAAKSGC